MMRYKYIFIPNYNKRQKKSSSYLTQHEVDIAKKKAQILPPFIVELDIATKGAYAIQTKKQRGMKNETNR